MNRMVVLIFPKKASIKDVNNMMILAALQPSMILATNFSLIMRCIVPSGAPEAISEFYPNAETTASLCTATRCVR